MHADRAVLVKRASWISLAGNSALAVAKLAAGALTGSLAVLSDGADSATDVLVSIMTLAAGRVAAKPGDREHPYGHGRAETMATTIIAFVVFFAGSQLFVSAAESLLHPDPPAMPGLLAVWVTVASILGKLALAWSQFHFGKIAGSSMLRANGKNMSGDVITSAAVLVGLSLGHILGLPILDRVMALLVSLWVMRNAVMIFRDANTELMDGTSDHGPYDTLFRAVAAVPEAGNPHRVRIRRLGSALIADLDIEVPPKMTVADAHAIAMRVERSIKDTMPEMYDVLVHVEPQGNIEDERHGLMRSRCDECGSPEGPAVFGAAHSGAAPTADDEAKPRHPVS